MKALPIRWKFALWSAALVAIVILAFAGATFLNLYREKLEEVDLELEGAGRHIAGLLPAALDGRTFDELVGFQPWLFVAIFDANGRIARRPDALPESVARAALQHEPIRTVHNPVGGQAWRVTSLRHAAGSTVVLAYSLEEVDEIVRDLKIACALSLPVVLLLAALGGWWISGRALTGLRELTASAESIRADQLHRRIQEPRAKDEIHRLVDVLNSMLGRLETSFRQSKRFAADASHELRTPLTIIGGEITRLLRIPDLPSEAEALALSAQEEIGRLQRITEQMLLLAQFDAGTANVPHVEIALSELLRDACEDAELLAAARDLTIDTDIAPGVAVNGDPNHLRRLFLNLLDNAVRYNQPAGKIRCTLRTNESTVVISVGNAGPGIPIEARRNLFQRFYRSDTARTRGGHGLGLSLCREIVRAHRGEIELEPSQPGWTEFVVRLPAV